MQSALTSLDSVKVSYFAPQSLQYKDETVPFTADAINDSINEVNRLVTAAKQNFNQKWGMHRPLET